MCVDRDATGLRMFFDTPGAVVPEEASVVPGNVQVFFDDDVVTRVAANSGDRFVNLEDYACEGAFEKLDRG